MEYKNTLSSATDYARNGKLEEWIHAYLLSDGRNKEFSDGLKKCDRYYLGPIRLPLSLFRRCCGPEEDMKWRVDKEGFERKVKALENAILAGKDIPPLIVNYVEGGFELNDGNHRFEAYSRLKTDASYVIVWITEKDEYDEFIEKFSSYMQ